MTDQSKAPRLTEAETLEIRERLKADFDRYCRALAEPNGQSTCYAIECRYELDGYPPEIVAAALSAGAADRDMDEEIDRLLEGDD